MKNLADATPQPVVWHLHPDVVVKIWARTPLRTFHPNNYYWDLLADAQPGPSCII